MMAQAKKMMQNSDWKDEMRRLEKAEEAIRQALINALAEGEDEYLSELFDTLNSVRDLRTKINNTIRFSDNTEDFYDRLN